MGKFRYYVELKGNDSQFHVYVMAEDVRQIKEMFSGYKIICIDQTD